MNRKPLVPMIALAVLLAWTAPAWAQEPVLRLTLKAHRFEPAELQAPAGTKILLVIKNEDSTPEEFESKDLKREKVIPGGGEVTIRIGPLKPGTYEFFGEFNPQTARGRLVVK
jgi:hypothetical protein